MNWQDIEADYWKLRYSAAKRVWDRFAGDDRTKLGDTQEELGKNPLERFIFFLQKDLNEFDRMFETP